MTEDSSGAPSPDFKVDQTVWYLDKKGKCRQGVIKSLGTDPSNGLYAGVYDETDRRNITLTLESLSRRPLDAPMARARKGREKKRATGRPVL